MKFIFYTDPGHGWLEVDYSMLKELNLEDKISSCSYISRDYTKAYLEEDCDGQLFCQEYSKKYGKMQLTNINTNNESFIRELPHFFKKGVTNQ